MPFCDLITNPFRHPTLPISFRGSFLHIFLKINQRFYHCVLFRYENHESKLEYEVVKQLMLSGVPMKNIYDKGKKIEFAISS